MPQLWRLIEKNCSMLILLLGLLQKLLLEKKDLPIHGETQEVKKIDKVGFAVKFYTE